MYKYQIKHEFNLTERLFWHLVKDNKIIKVSNKCWKLDEKFFDSFDLDTYILSVKQRQKTNYRNAAKRHWSNMEYRKTLSKAQSAATKKRWSNPVQRDSLCKAIKDSWAKEDVRTNHIKSYKRSFVDTDRAKMHSEEMKRRWSNTEYKNKVSKSIHNAKSSSVAREQISKIAKESLNKPEVKHKCSLSAKQSWLLHKDEILQKQYDTKKQNHSFNSSSTEEQTFELLKQFFQESDICHPLKPFEDERYPYECDFYIKSLDLFIECNYHWTHGGRLFDETDESCIEQLNKWKEKALTSKFYQNAIDTWTIRDTKKRKHAIDNKLKWKCFYTFKIFENWLKEELSWRNS